MLSTTICSLYTHTQTHTYKLIHTKLIHYIPKLTKKTLFTSLPQDLTQLYILHLILFLWIHSNESTLYLYVLYYYSIIHIIIILFILFLFIIIFYFIIGLVPRPIRNLPCYSRFLSLIRDTKYFITSIIPIKIHLKYFRFKR